MFNFTEERIGEHAVCPYCKNPVTLAPDTDPTAGMCADMFNTMKFWGWGMILVGVVGFYYWVRIFNPCNNDSNIFNEGRLNERLCWAVFFSAWVIAGSVSLGLSRLLVGLVRFNEEIFRRQNINSRPKTEPMK